MYLHCNGFHYNKRKKSFGGDLMGFLLGCNYWASNAGIEMWKKCEKSEIFEDFRKTIYCIV